MKEYEKHVIKMEYEDGKPITPTFWCGAKYYKAFHFADAQHAALNADQGGRLVCCPACAEAIINALATGGVR